MGSELETAVSQLKMGIAAQKAQSLSNVANAKARLLSTQEVVDTARAAAASAAAFTSEITTPETKEEIRREGNVIYYSDGSMGYVGNNDRVTPIVDNKQLEQVRAQEDARQADEAAGVVGGSFQDTVGTFLGTATDIAAGGAKILATSDQTLTSAIKTHNNIAKGTGAAERGEMQSISGKTATKFRELHAKIGTKKEFTPEDLTFMDTPEYALVKGIQDQVDEERSKAASIDEFKDKFNNFVAPTAQGDDVAYAIGKENAEADGGTMGAIAYQFENIGHMVKSGVASIPYTIANTIGGPVAQMAILAVFSRKKAAELTEDFIRENNREPTEEELTRLNLAGFLSATSEKFGDVLLIKGFNLGRFNKSVKAIADSTPSPLKRYIAKPIMGLAGESSSGMLTELADQYGVYGEVESGSKVVQAGVEESVGAVGGISGIVLGKTAIASARGTVRAAGARSRAERLRETLAAPQTVADTPEGQEIQARVDEINATIEGNALDTMSGVEAEAPNIIQLSAEKAQLQAQLDAPAEGALPPEERAKAQAEYDALPNRVKPEVVATKETEGVTTAENIADNVEVDTSDITPEDFEIEIAQISSDDTPLQERIEAFVALKSRGMTTEQKKEREALADVLTKAAEDFGNTSESAPSMKPTKKDSYGIINDDGTLETDQEYDRTKLEETATDPNVEEADRQHAEALIGAQDTRAKIETRNNGTMAGVATDVREGTNDRWLGFKTYVDQINEINQRIKSAASEVEGSNIFQEVKSTLSKMRTHQQNMANKTAAFQKAMDASVSSGTPRYIRGNTGAGYHYKNNRVMEYVDPIAEKEEELGRELTSAELEIEQKNLQAAYNNRETSGEYIYRLDAKDPASQALLETVKDEATYGEYMVTAAETHSQTSYHKTAGLNARDKAKLEKQIEDIKNEAPIIEDTETASDQEIDDAFDNLTEEAPESKIITKAEAAKRPIRLIIAGGLKFTDKDALRKELNAFMAEGNKDPKDVVIVSGTARGADKIGEELGKELGIDIVQFKTKWKDANGVYNNTAWKANNAAMAELGTHLLVGFNGTSRGTQHMIDLAREAGLPVFGIGLPDDTTNAVPTSEARSTNDSDNTTEEGDSLGEAPPPADGPETTTTEEQSEDVSEESTTEETQQDDLDAEQDVLEEEVYDPSILTTEERIIEAMNNDTALADSPNTSSETIKEYNALKKELDELNQIIRCLKT